MNIRLIFKLLGGVNLFLCLFMLPPLLLAVVEGDGWSEFAWSLLIGMSFSGLLLWRFRGLTGELRVREGFLLVALVWCLCSLFGALPFYFSGHFGSFTSAVFESVSGYTTTGATVLAQVSTLSRGLLLWRSMIQWLGGMGIVLLSLAVMPLLGFGAVQLFKAEVPGPEMERIQPRVRATAKLLWWVYLLLTAVAAFCLMAAGMSPFDALCHALTVMATGGFSTHDQGVMGYQSPMIEIVLIFFMLLAGVNFVLHYHALCGRRRAYIEHEEFRWYIGLFLMISAAIAGLLVVHGLAGPLPAQIRHALFQTASMMTT
ncbi:MAG: TrkH family potassium uptake protein, partial [Lentisphaerae bacterium]|nr:TrkH family potassium uptake protein [Lentisphaerota bacterium]